MRWNDPRVLVWIGVVCLAGCQSTWEFDPNLGSTVNGAIHAQLVDPTAPVDHAYGDAKMDGTVAKQTIDSYQKSFSAPSSGDAGQGSLMTIINK